MGPLRLFLFLFKSIVHSPICLVFHRFQRTICEAIYVMQELLDDQTHRFIYIILHNLK